MSESKETTYWAGCNFHINQGKNEEEPLGTAQSIHDCDGCDKLAYCTIKQDTPTWAWNEDKDLELKDNWKAMHSNIN